MVAMKFKILTFLLVLSIAGNVALWFWGSSAQHSAQTYRQDLEIIVGSNQGIEAAKKDFAAGTPLWYQFPGERAEEILKAKPGRTLRAYELWSVPERHHFIARAFIDGYNHEMDTLFASTTPGSPTPSCSNGASRC